MEMYELDDIHDKIAFHCAEVENNLDSLDSLIDSLNLETYFVEELRQSLRAAFLDIEQKCDRMKEEMAKGE